MSDLELTAKSLMVGRETTFILTEVIKAYFVSNLYVVIFKVKTSFRLFQFSKFTVFVRIINNEYYK